MQPSDQLPIQGLAPANPHPPTRQPSHKQQGLAAGVAPRRGAPTLPTLDAPPSQGLADLDELVAQLALLRSRLNAGMLYLYRFAHDAKRGATGEHRLVRLATDEYLPLIAQLRTFPATDLAAHRDAVAERLATGFAVQGGRADKLFAELLCEYEALEDALMADCLSPLFDRIAAVRA